MTTLVVHPPSAEGAVILKFDPARDLMDDDVLFDFCQKNERFKIERTAAGRIIMHPPTGFETGIQNSGISAQLWNWAQRDGRGEAADSSAGFILPNRAERSPDASWILKSRLASIPLAQKKKFLPAAPDFVIELRSPSESLADLQQKMEEYMQNGVSLGWLIDPTARQVHIYSPDRAPEVLDRPMSVEGRGLVGGFVLDLTGVWRGLGP